MRTAKPACALSLLLCLAASAGAIGAAGARRAAKEAARTSPALFERARVVGDEAAPAAFEFELSGYSYRVASNGAGRRTKGEEARPFNLRLDGLEFIERVYYQEYDGNVLLVCWLKGGDADAAFVARLGQPSMRARWKQRVPARGVAAVRDGGSLYLAGRGLIARIDLGTGDYLWLHDDVAEAKGVEERGEAGESRGRKVVIPSAYFGPPEFAGDAVIFREGGASGRPPLKAVHVNRKSGKIIRIE